MADVFDTATRSRIMRANKSRDTKPELALLRALRAGKPAYLFVSRPRKRGRLPCRPDFLLNHAWTGTRLAVFVHGCWWHCCPKHWHAPKSGAGKGGATGWADKFAANRRRDVRVRRQLRRLGWRTMVVWEHEDMARAATRVVRRIEAAR